MANLRTATVFDDVTAPTSYELVILRELLRASQIKWVEYFQQRHLDPATTKADRLHFVVSLPWSTLAPEGGSLLDADTQNLAYAARRLENAGWINTLRMTNSTLTTSLPFHFVEFAATLAEEPMLPPAGDDLASQCRNGFHQLLQAQQQLLWDAVEGSLLGTEGTGYVLLSVGEDIPLPLAQSLADGGLLTCYVPDIHCEHTGPQTAVAVGKVATLCVQDDELSHRIVKLISAA